MSNTNTTAIVLSIMTLNTVVAGKFKESFAVVDQEGELIGSKAHGSRQEAELELGTLKFFAEGMTFARSVAKEGTPDKTLVGKANVVASYLMYLEQENAPVVEVPDTSAADPAPVVNDPSEF